MISLSRWEVVRKIFRQLGILACEGTEHADRKIVEVWNLLNPESAEKWETSNGIIFMSKGNDHDQSE